MPFFQAPLLRRCPQAAEADVLAFQPFKDQLKAMVNCREILASPSWNIHSQVLLCFILASMATIYGGNRMVGLALRGQLYDSTAVCRRHHPRYPQSAQGGLQSNPHSHRGLRVGYLSPTATTKDPPRSTCFMVNSDNEGISVNQIYYREAQTQGSLREGGSCYPR